MPLTEKGQEIMAAMTKPKGKGKKKGGYGKKKGKRVFYASMNKGTITGVHRTYHRPVKTSVLRD